MACRRGIPLVLVLAVVGLAGAAQLAPGGAARVAAATAATPVKVNFQPAASPIPSGYVVDSGAAFDDARGYGWITQASLSGTHQPLDLSPNTRDRNLESDQRLDTVIHMQYPPASSSTTAVKTPAAWEYAVPNGDYDVAVVVGDPLTGSDPENYVVHAEGVTAVAGYVPSGPAGSATRHASATVTVTVADGRLTLDAVGGTNTKLDYVEITAAAGPPPPPPPPPTSVNVNFQPATAPVPSGYSVDSGAAWTDARGYGWVTQASLSGSSHSPLDLTPNTRDRNLESDQRLDTIIHMQYPPSSSSTTAVKTPGAWEYAIAGGSYRVTVAVGDGLVGSDAESYTVRVEGVTAVNAFVPTGGSGSATRHSTATVTVSVADGRLTLDAIGGTNTKLDYVQIAPAAADTTPPAPPASVSATPGDGQVTLGWAANTEPDLAGYNVYRGTSQPVALSSPLNGSTPLTQTSFVNTGLTNGTTYYYVVEAVDTSGNKAQGSTVSATPQGAATGGPDVQVNFQDQATTPPAGYVADWGQPFGARSSPNQGSGLSYGWVTPGTSAPLSLVGNGRNRNSPPYSVNNPDLRLATFMHMQGNDVSGFGGIAVPGAWEVAVPNGTYTVTVAVGDDVNTDSTNKIQVEGQTMIPAFAPVSTNRHLTASRVIAVSDGRLTLDAAGGRNTKIDYVKVVAGGTSAFTDVAWSTVAASPIGRAEAQGAVVDGKLYVFGGYVDGTFTPTTRMDVYDPGTNSWSRLASMPIGLTHIGVAVSGRDIYIAGGYPPGPGGTYQTWATTSVSKYNVDTNTWTAMPSLPEARGGGALAIENGNLHFFGGSDINRADASSHWILTLPGGSSWQTSTALPVSRNHLGGVTLNGKIYAVGGQRGQDAAAVYTAAFDVWDPATSAWKSLAPLPNPRSHISAASFSMGGRVIALGGEVAYGYSTAQAVAYDPTADTWVELTPLPIPIHSGIAGDIGGVIYYTTGAFQTTTYKGVPGS